MTDDEDTERNYETEINELDNLLTQMEEEIEHFRGLHALLDARGEESTNLSNNPLTDSNESTQRTTIRVSDPQKTFADEAYDAAGVKSKEQFYGLCVAFAQNYPTLLQNFIYKLKFEDEYGDFIQTFEDTSIEHSSSTHYATGDRGETQTDTSVTQTDDEQNQNDVEWNPTDVDREPEFESHEQ